LISDLFLVVVVVVIVDHDNLTLFSKIKMLNPG